jgi:hypothetical protein
MHNKLFLKINSLASLLLWLLFSLSAKATAYSTSTTRHLWIASGDLCFGALHLADGEESDPGQKWQDGYTRRYHFFHYAAGRPLGGGKGMRDIAYA